MTVLVDSDVLIEVTRGRNEEVLAKWIALSETEAVVLYSPVTAAELWAGARPKEFGLLTSLFRGLTCCPIDELVARQAGLYLHQYRKSHAIELADALIAAGAAATGASLWTRNRKHFPMKGLVFFD